MKKTIFALLLIVLISLSSCGIPAMFGLYNVEELDISDVVEPEEKKKASEENAKSGEVVEDFGTYTVPEDWSEAVELSRGDKTFYIQNGTPIDKPATNISVNVGTNKYAQDDAISFARAINAQIQQQAGSLELKSYTGDGTFTEKDYPLIVIKFEAEDMITSQYYICGDYRYVMVHLTEIGENSTVDAESVALSMVNSFVWAD